MARRKLSRSEIEEQYRIQWKLLRNSCGAYDGGDENEAKRIALSLRVLVHDTVRSSSLLRQLELHDALFFDTAEDINRANLLPTFGLVLVRLSPEGARYVAPIRPLPLPRPPWLIPFEHWWNKTVIRIPGLFDVPRRDLVLCMADQDGGAHVDPSVDENYYRLTRENALGFVVTVDGQTYPIPHIATASIRQVAEEVLTSLIEPRNMIPDNLPDEEGEEYQVTIHDARTGTTRTEVKRRNVICICHSGLRYKDCHAKGGQNWGKIVAPMSI